MVMGISMVMNDCWLLLAMGKSVVLLVMGNSMVLINDGYY